MSSTAVGLGMVLFLVGCTGAEPPGARATSTSESLRENVPPVSADKTQLITVVSERWDSFRGVLRRYTRAGNGSWQAVDGGIPVVLGHAGYGWGRGRHGDGDAHGLNGPTKREGDGRSPAGVFDVGTAYGYDRAPTKMALPYVQASTALRCVDDPRSVYYNEVVSTTVPNADWRSAERMVRNDDAYWIAIVIEHNTADTAASAGSCIFLHVWADPDTPVRGCTAMAKSDLERLAKWLRPQSAVLVALPRAAYLERAQAWGLPSLDTADSPSTRDRPRQP